MAWIESHQSLERHPKLLSIAVKLNTDKFGAIGRIHCLWWWCLDYATDGDLRKFDADTVTLACSIPMDLLLECEFVDKRPYLRVHDWWHYAGRFIKIKFKDYPEKWKRIESLYKGALKGSRNPSLKPTNQPTDLNQPNQPTLPGFNFQTIWKDYPRKLGKDAAERHFRAQVKTDADFLDIKLALANYIADLRKKGTDEQYIMYGSSWFNKKWRDWIAYKGAVVPPAPKVFKKPEVLPPDPTAADIKEMHDDKVKKLGACRVHECVFCVKVES